MSYRLRLFLGLMTLVIAVAAGSAAFTSPASRESGEVSPVSVTNFPATQKVEGNVKIEGPLPMTSRSALRHVEVPPRLAPTAPRLAASGSIETDGFGSVVLSLSAAETGQIPKPGTVGALLLPDEESILEAFETRGIVQFALKLEAECAAGASVCSSEPTRQVVAFPRYRAYFYNTTERMARVDLYAYLTH